MSLFSRYSFSSSQLDHFHEQGYLKLSKLIPESLLNQLKESLEPYCNPNQNYPGVAVLEGKNGTKFTIGVDNLVSREASIFRHLLGSPLLLSLAEGICGPDFFPVQDFAVIKTLGDGSQVNWHQDVVSQSRARCIMIGLYLDPATEENGALRIIPKSHCSKDPLCELQKMAYQSIEMDAGDILIHDLMLAHSSGPLSTFPQRRVVYFEFFEAAKAQLEHLYSEEFVTLRTSLIPYAIQALQEDHPDTLSFEWKNSAKENFPTPLPTSLAIQTIYNSKLHSRPANYCFDFPG